jgi:ATP-dependent Lon protease
MVKRLSRENARDRSGTEDMSDKSPPHKRRRYNLRERKPPPDQEPLIPPTSELPKDTKRKALSTKGSQISSVKKPVQKKKKIQNEEEVLWINDDTLSAYSSESSYVESQDDKPININICIHKSATTDTDSEEEEEESDKTLPKEDGFLMYLLEKYATAEKEEDQPKQKKGTHLKLPMKLSQSENRYFKSLDAKRQKEFVRLMEKVVKTGFEDGDIPYKFRILDLPISEYMKSHVIKKSNALSDMPPDSGESYKLKNWIDGLLRIPFGKSVPLPVRLEDGRDKCTVFMKESKKTMDSAIYGMDGAKTQIMQIIAQWIVNPSSVGNVIALQGPMGVGKTSFAKNAIAKVLNRPFEFFSLGGASDISNFVGHSYTYEGSIWGRIAESLMRAGTMNPVFYFDEVDKISTTPQGEEVTNMLIHLTDRSQNTQFHDRYFSGIEFDLSQCLFVFSLNDIEKVHPILRDRMTMITCGGYDEKDKKEILKSHIWPQLLDRLKFKDDEVELTDSGMTFLISEYSANEKGVRTLIRTVESMMTRLNMLRVADSETMKSYNFYMDVEFPIKITEQVIRTLLCDFNKKELESWRSMYV